jgi:predicted acyl esterase
MESLMAEDLVMVALDPRSGRVAHRGPPGVLIRPGSPVVHVSVTVDGVDAVLAARLWDVDPVAGSQALVARTVYRISVPTPGTTSPVAFELFANAWQVAAGHRLKLELTQDDAPYWRADNLASALGYAGLRLDIPLR